ncbi:MAG: LytTR family DNA-binding domain-containing protein [Niabella sp.]
MTKCVVIDDEQPAINVLKNYIERIDYLQLMGTATNPIKGIELIKEQQADLVFLDIQMDEMTGIEVMSQLDENVQVIFCTAYSEFAVKSYDLNAVDYLMKPIGFSRFLKAIKKVRSDNDTNINAPGNDYIPADYIFVKTEVKGKMIRIDLDDIDFVEAKNNYVAVHRSGDVVMVYSTLQDFEENLPSQRFIRIHKSFIIAVNKVSLIEKNYVVLMNSTEHIPISKTYKNNFQERVRDNLFNT